MQGLPVRVPPGPPRLPAHLPPGAVRTTLASHAARTSVPYAFERRHHPRLLPRRQLAQHGGAPHRGAELGGAKLVQLSACGAGGVMGGP